MTPSTIADRLIKWHDPALRGLPWRTAPAGQRDPYAVWISEIMAQQTRLETVVAYFERWMTRFPTIQALAQADLQDVLKIWEGLGYYARARNIHRAARQIVAEFNGKVPDDHKTLLSLPGIGEYTAGAILSTAFGQPTAVVDGNVARVLSRLYDIAQPIDQTATKKELWRLAEELVKAAPSGKAGALNEALMELGAYVCTPTTPRCLVCPVHDFCQAVQRGVQHERPVLSPKKKTPHYDVAAGVIWQATPFASKCLIAQRPVEGMLGGLWEFPGGKLEPSDANLAVCLQREIAEELAIDIEVNEQFAVVQHAYTHFRITLHAFHARHVSGTPQAIGCADWRWVTLTELTHFPFPVTDQKIIQVLLQGGA